MGRAPCCDKSKVKKGPWSKEEDNKLKEYIEKNGTGGNWIALPQKAGLKRCGKSCRLRWLNYLRPNIKHGAFSDDEDRIICTLYATIGSRWSLIAAQLPGRTDNDIKNYWNTKLKKKLLGIPPSQRKLNQHKKCQQEQEQQIFPSSLPALFIQPDQMSHQQGNLLEFGSHREPTITYGSSELEFGVRDDMGFDSSIYGGLDEENQKLLFSDQILQYGSYEDIKHLVSTNNVCSSLYLDQHYPTS